MRPKAGGMSESISIRMPMHMLAPEWIKASIGLVSSASISGSPDGAALMRSDASFSAAPSASRLVLDDSGVCVPENVASFASEESTSEPVVCVPAAAAARLELGRVLVFLKCSFSFAMMPSRIIYALRSFKKLFMPSMMLSCSTPMTADMICVCATTSSYSVPGG